MTNSMREVLEADVILVTGSNTTEAHPVLGCLVKHAVKYRGAKLILVDPRRIELSQYATLHLRPKNGTDVAWLNGMMHVILREGLEDREFIAGRTENFEEFRAVVEKYTPERVEEITGLPPAQLVAAARLYACVDRASLLYAMGLTQHVTGVDNVLSVANLALLTGNVGRVGTGVNPLRGQNNVQGSCDMGCLPNVFPGYQRVTDPAVREKFEQAWGVPLSDQVGLTVVEMLHAAGGEGRGGKGREGEGRGGKEREGEGRGGKGREGDAIRHPPSIRAMYIMGENPMMSDPNVNHVREALESLDFLVVQDLFLTETAQWADVVLPSASFAEKDGTFTNTGRRVQRVRKALDPPGQARTDGEILQDLAARMGYELVRDAGRGTRDAGRGIPTSYPSSLILEEIASLTPSYGGMAYDRLEGEGLQWPCPDREHPGTPILHREKFTRGLGRFTPVDFLPPAEWPDEEYPFLLSTGRMLYHFHTGSMTRRSRALDALWPDGYVEMNPQDAARLGLTDHDPVRVVSRRGEATMRVRVTDRPDVGSLFAPFHFAEGAANLLTNDALDPTAKIPEYKVAAVRVEKVAG